MRPSNLMYMAYTAYSKPLACHHGVHARYTQDRSEPVQPGGSRDTEIYLRLERQPDLS